MTKTVSLVYGDDKLTDLVGDYLAASLNYRRGEFYSSIDTLCSKRAGFTADIILVSGRVGKVSGIECLIRLKKALPTLPCVLCTTAVDFTSFVRAFQAGADGYLVMPSDTDSFEQTLAGALSGWKPFPKEAQRVVVNHLIKSVAMDFATKSLTPAEHRVMSHLIQGAREKEIAAITGTSTATVHSLT